MTAEESEGAHARGRDVVLGVLRAVTATVVLVTVYFLLPLDSVTEVPGWIALPVVAVGFCTLMGVQVRTILRVSHPAIRAVEALSITIPLFLLTFAGTYYVQAAQNPANFSQTIDRLDALYFTVTVFTTTGFGDITAVSAPSRATTTVQMVLDLLIIGVGIRLILGAVQIRRGKRADPTLPSP